MSKYKECDVALINKYKQKKQEFAKSKTLQEGANFISKLLGQYGLIFKAMVWAEKQRGNHFYDLIIERLQEGDSEKDAVNYAYLLIYKDDA